MGQKKKKEREKMIYYLFKGGLLEKYPVKYSDCSRLADIVVIICFHCQKLCELLVGWLFQHQGPASFPSVEWMLRVMTSFLIVSRLAELQLFLERGIAVGNPYCISTAASSLSLSLSLSLSVNITHTHSNANLSCSGTASQSNEFLWTVWVMTCPG